MIFGSLASYPARKKCLEQVVAAVIPQLDHLYVYLNHYEVIPEFLHHAKISVARSQDHGDLVDNGKFFCLHHNIDGYHFVLDDDISYPCDYAKTLLHKIEMYNRLAVVGVHGAVLRSPFEHYFQDRDVATFWTALEQDKTVNVLGTGTLAYHTSALQLSLSDFHTTCMADIWFAIAAKQQAAPMIAVARPDNWLQQIPLDNPKDCLYERFKEDDAVQTSLIHRYGNWSFDENPAIYMDLAQHVSRYEEARLQQENIDAAWWRQFVA